MKWAAKSENFRSNEKFKDRERFAACLINEVKKEN